MSWWDDGAEVLGDAPADRLTAAWRRVLLPRREAGTAQPTMHEVLAAFAASLRTGELVPAFQRLVLYREPGPPLVFEGGEDAPSDLCATFDQAVAAIVTDYRSALERAPTPMELAKTLDFVVRPVPAQYFRDAAEALGGDSWRLRAEPGGSTSR